jgi:hypothetical protein
MATVNALKCKHPENEVKMHFTYLQQCLADSSSPSKDLNKVISTSYPATDLIGILSSLLESWDCIRVFQTCAQLEANSNLNSSLNSSLNLASNYELGPPNQVIM